MNEHATMRVPSGERLGQRRTPLICEFVGLPGAGKSTVARRVVQQLQTRGWRCGQRRAGEARSRVLSRLRKSVFHLRHPSHFLTALQFSVTLDPFTIAAVSRAHRVAGQVYGLARAGRADEDAVILDQGLVQAVWSLTLPAGRWRQDALDRLLSCAVERCTAPVVLVYLELDPVYAARRLLGRGSGESRFEHLPPWELAGRLSQAEVALKRLFERAVDLWWAPSCRVDGGAPPDEVCTAVVRFLDALPVAPPVEARPPAPRWVKP